MVYTSYILSIRLHLFWYLSRKVLMFGSSNCFLLELGETGFLLCCKSKFSSSRRYGDEPLAGSTFQFFISWAKWCLRGVSTARFPSIYCYCQVGLFNRDGVPAEPTFKLLEVIQASAKFKESCKFCFYGCAGLGSIGSLLKSFSFKTLGTFFDFRWKGRCNKDSVRKGAATVWFSILWCWGSDYWGLC